MHSSSSTSVRRDAVPSHEVLAALRVWAEELTRRLPEVVRVGYFGSYARGDYVPGSDLDVVIELSASDDPHWSQRIARFLPARFPVAPDVFPYTQAELERLEQEGNPFWREVQRTLKWLEP